MRRKEQKAYRSQRSSSGRSQNGLYDSTEKLSIGDHQESEETGEQLDDGSEDRESCSPRYRGDSAHDGSPKGLSEVLHRSKASFTKDMSGKKTPSSPPSLAKNANGDSPKGAGEPKRRGGMRGSDVATASLWLGNMDPEADEDDLRALFAQYGAVESVRVLRHAECAFVNFYRVADAQRAIQALQGAPFGHTRLQIQYQLPREIRQQEKAANLAAKLAAAAAKGGSTTPTPPPFPTTTTTANKAVSSPTKTPLAGPNASTPPRLLTKPKACVWQTMSGSNLLSQAGIASNMPTSRAATASPTMAALSLFQRIGTPPAQQQQQYNNNVGQMGQMQALRLGGMSLGMGMGMGGQFVPRSAMLGESASDRASRLSSWLGGVGMGMDGMGCTGASMLAADMEPQLCDYDPVLFDKDMQRAPSSRTSLASPNMFLPSHWPSDMGVPMPVDLSLPPAAQQAALSQKDSHWSTGSLGVSPMYKSPTPSAVLPSSLFTDARLNSPSQNLATLAQLRERERERPASPPDLPTMWEAQAELLYSDEGEDESSYVVLSNPAAQISQPSVFDLASLLSAAASIKLPSSSPAPQGNQALPARQAGPGRQAASPLSPTMSMWSPAATYTTPTAPTNQFNYLNLAASGYAPSSSPPPPLPDCLADALVLPQEGPTHSRLSHMFGSAADSPTLFEQYLLPSIARTSGTNASLSLSSSKLASLHNPGHGTGSAGPMGNTFAPAVSGAGMGMHMGMHRSLANERYQPFAAPPLVSPLSYAQ